MKAAELLARSEGFSSCKPIYHVLAGSHSYGTQVEGSDEDHRVICVRPTVEILGLKPCSDVVCSKEGAEVDYQIWEVAKFLNLLCSSNPNALEILGSDVRLGTSDFMEELKAEQHRFYSKCCAPRLKGFMMQQYDNLVKAHTGETDEYSYDSKAAMHASRLAYVGCKLAKEHNYYVRVPDDIKEKLMLIRNKKVPFWAVVDHIKGMEALMSDAFENSTLPEKPDFDYANDFLLRIRKENW